VAVTGGDDDALQLWDLATGRAFTERLIGHTRWISTVACSERDGHPVVVSGSADRTVRVWQPTTRSCEDVLALPAEVHAVSVAPDGGMVVCTGSDVVVFDRFAEGKR
jgi:WD40 repeat protein